VRAIEQLVFRILILLVVSFSAIAADKKVAEIPDLVSLAETARRSVAVVMHHGRDGKEDGVGAGFIVSKDGLIATCLHVIGEARPITVELSDGRRFSATEVFASDRKLDLALVRIGATNLVPLKLGDSDALKQGAPVVAIGNPVGLENSLVQGIVSARRDFDGVEMIQLAIPIESGNSGGPLLDGKGRVQGLLNMKSAITANLGFAVPVNALKLLLDQPNPVPMTRWLSLGALNPKEWTPLMGARWSRKAGRIDVDGLGSGFGGRSLCLSAQPVPEPPYELAVTVKLDDEAGAAGLAFESDGGDRHFGFYPTAGQMRLTRFDGPSVFSWTILKEFKTPHYKPGEWNTIKVRVETNRIVGFVNGERVMEATGETLRSGKAGLAKFRDTRAQFKNFAVGGRVETAPASTPSRDESAAIVRQLQNDAGKSDAELLASLDSTSSSTGALLLEQAGVLDRQARQIRRVAAALHARAVEKELVKVLGLPEEQIDLFQAALLVAKLDNAELEIEPYRIEVQRMAQELKSRVPNGANDQARLAAISQYLFSDNGFHGCRTDYYNRANSYINDVMDDREGLPITLSVLYLELARQIGLTNVVGVPIPTRFMVSFRPADQAERIVDVFDNGKLLTRSQAVELVAEDVDSIGEEAFRAATKREVITRMLRNLLGIAQRGGSATDAVRYLDVIVALNPDSALDRFSRTRHEIERGDNGSAKADVQWLLDHESPGIDPEQLRELYRSL
jgi:regulator of sirC expression with transglutaminase-like and TPR domain